jgi:glycosyltransferase involved in cell wall biosynthesis
MRVLVVTVVHRPDDARILHRQIASLTRAGHSVTYAAPFTACGVVPPSDLRTFDMPRAAGRTRTAAGRAARSLLKAQGPRHDVVLLHDPELLLAAAGLDLPCVVWDVHEDTAAALTMKSWLPAALRPPVGAGVRAAEHWAERSFHLILAEDGYVSRFDDIHPVVPNSTWVPVDVQPPSVDRAVYIGAVTRARGALELIEVGRRLQGSGIGVHVVGHADAEVAAALSAAHDDGVITAHGFMPNDAALALLDGALAGLSLLHDEANYRHSRPTKIIEYMSRGVPAITTPTPPAVALVEGADCGVVVPFNDPQAVASALIALADDEAERRRLGANGHVAALRDHDWNTAGPRFVALLEGWAGPTA